MFHRRRWFAFDGLKWVYSPWGPRDELSTTVVDAYEAERDEFNGPVVDETIMRLKHAAFKDAITTCCQPLFAYGGPLDLHAGRYLCFADGIVDAETGELRDRGDPAWRTTVWFDCPREAALHRLSEFVEAAQKQV